MTGPTVINKHFLCHVFAAVWGSSDLPEEYAPLYLEYDPECSEDVEAFISNEMLPNFQEWGPKSMEKLRLCLQYYLQRAELGDAAILAELQSTYDDAEVIVPCPDDIRDFYRAVWRIYFPNTEARLKKGGNYVIINEPDSPVGPEFE